MRCLPVVLVRASSLIEPELVSSLAQFPPTTGHRDMSMLWRPLPNTLNLPISQYTRSLCHVPVVIYIRSSA